MPVEQTAHKYFLHNPMLAMRLHCLPGNQCSTQKTNKMKRLILMGLLAFFAAGKATAQTSSGGSGSRTTGAVSSTGSTNSTKTTKNKKGTKKQTAVLNPRKEYKSKNGQTATPTGHEATGTGAANTPPQKNAATRKDTIRQERQ